MERIATASRAIDLFGAGKDGFTEGTPLTGVPPTSLSAAWFNGVQEAIARVIEYGGVALSNGDHTQLRAAVQALARDMTINARWDATAELWHHEDVDEDAHRLVFTASGLALYTHAAPGVAGGFADNAWSLRDIPTAYGLEAGTARAATAAAQLPARWASQYEGYDGTVKFAGIFEMLMRAGTGGDSFDGGGSGVGLRSYTLYGRHITTVNARWSPDDELWHRDDVLKPSTQLLQTPSGFYILIKPAGGLTFADGAWQPIFGASEGVIGLTGELSVTGRVSAPRVLLTEDATPPAANTLYKKSICRAWGVFETDGAGGFAWQEVHGCTLAVVGTSVVVTLSHALVSSRYAPVPVVCGAANLVARPVLVSDTVWHIIVVDPTTNLPADLGDDAGIQVAFHVFGRGP